MVTAPRRFELASANPRQYLVLGAVVTSFSCATPASADPCEGVLPARGAVFSGVVRYVGDGDGLCIGPARRPDRWIEVRLADFDAPELNEPGGQRAKRLLASIVMGRSLTCRAGRRSYDRIVAHCRLDERPLGNLLRDRGGREGGR